ncbi:MAG: acyloxyacyl hydrolase [Ramlibacter sp.]
MQPKKSLLAALAACSALLVAPGARAADLKPAWYPDAMILQGGSGTHVESSLVGLSWDTGWRREFGGGSLEMSVEATLGQWRTTGRVQDEQFTQFGVSPVLRFYPRAVGSGWFVEGGIGANSIAPLYRNGGKEFSTRFNFGDQLAVGRRFGAQGSQEVSLRAEHFSNCAMKHPNPGENFLQLRYAVRF